MKKILSSILSLVLLGSFTVGTFADVKIRQKVTMSGQTFETTKMIKGARQRTEQKGSGAMAFMSQVATIEQCDLRRNVQLNESKKLYFIDPFAEPSTEQPNAPSTRNSKPETPNRDGGTVTMTYVVTDTGERQTLFGLQARHLKILQETESSADSCGGARKSKMEIDGWYVDFSADFNCPMEFQRTPGQVSRQPDCRDRIVFKGNRNAKTGFLLNGTMTMYDESGKAVMTQTTETLELSRSPLAAVLFDIPADYKLAASQQELYAMPDVNAMMREQQQQQQRRDDRRESPSMPASSGRKNVGVNVLLGAEARVDQTEISRYLQDKLRAGNFDSRIGTSGVDYVLNVEIKKVKESAASKAGGLFGKVTGIETKAGKTEVELVVTLLKAGSQVRQSNVKQKFDGAAAEAVNAALDQAMDNVLSAIEN